MKGSTLLWFVLFGAVFFFLGFYAHKYATQASDQTPPTYLDRLTRALGLDEDQQKGVQTLMEEEDQAVHEILNGAHGIEIQERISEVRKGISKLIYELLDDEQKKRFTGLDPAPDPVESRK